MPPDELEGDVLDDVTEDEGPLSRADFCVHQHLQEHIAELFGQRRGLSRIYRFQGLVGLLEEVRAERRMSLLPVPGAAAGGVEPRHNRDEPIETADVGDGFQRRDEECVEVAERPVVQRHQWDRPDRLARAPEGVKDRDFMLRRVDLQQLQLEGTNRVAVEHLVDQRRPLRVQAQRGCRIADLAFAQVEGE